MLSVVAAHVRESEEDASGAKVDLWHENVETRRAFKRLQEAMRIHAYVEKFEDEAHRYRAELFLNGPEAWRARQYEKDMIDLPPIWWGLVGPLIMPSGAIVKSLDAVFPVPSPPTPRRSL